MGDQSFQLSVTEARFSSVDLPGPAAVASFRLDYFQGGPGRLDTRELTEHTMLIPLQADEMRFVQRRNGERLDLALSKDDINATPAGTISSWEWHGPAEFAIVQVSPTGVRDFVAGDLRLLASGSCLETMITFQDSELFALVTELKQAVEVPGPGQSILFDALARVFLITLARRYLLVDAAPYSGEGGLDVERYGALLDYIDGHIDRTLRTPDLAHHLGMSESVFTRAVKHSAGMTPQDLIRHRRIAAARSLLQRSDASLGEIALATGFADQAHLSRSFKAATGETPSSYRKHLF